MRLPAEQFLVLRAFGAPAIVIALAAQGTFRGFMDTKTPLFATVTGNLLNAILDPVLIFSFGLGIGGAAISTVISEYLIAVILLRQLSSKVLLVSPSISGRRIGRYLTSGGLLVGRTIAVLFTMTLATSMAARQGPIPMAGHQICLQVWLAVSLLTDALALAGQALLASGYSQRDYIRAQDVIYKVLQIGLLTGVALAVMLFLGFETFSHLFTSDSAVLEITRSGVLFVAGSQPVSALAFVLDGLYYGVSDFAYAAYSMVLVGLITSMFLYFAAPVYGLAGVWMGVVSFYEFASSCWTMEREGNRKGPTSSSEHEGPKTPDPKTLRRLAQNREAARKSRLRKKAYVQQLESSRIKLTQLEQELQRARAQGVFYGGGALIADQGLPVGINNLSSESTLFDMEYARWLEEHHRLMCELQAAVQEHLPENELRLFVDNCLAHYDEMIGLKSMVVKSDVFHLVSGTWKTPAERCFLWMGGFRPSEMIKIILNHIEPLTEQQILGICALQQSTQEAEEALNQGLDALYQSLSDTIASDALSYPSNMGNYMGQMAIAMNKLSTLEGFVRQADNLRHQTLHRLHQILTTRQAARCFLAMAEYFHRLRALSSLWLSRPRQD